MGVQQMLNTISSRELTEWLIYSNVEPIGINAHYVGHAIVAQTVANSQRKKGTKPFETKDFMPQFEKKDQTIDEMLQFAEMITTAYGGKDLRDDG